MLSDKIKEMRVEKGLSQEELAGKLNVVRQTISKWEKGLSVPDSDMLISLAKALDTSVYILLEEETPTPESATPKRKSTKIVTIIFLILGSPIWISLILATIAVIVAVYAVIWSVIVSLWAMQWALIGCTLGAMASGVGCIYAGDGLKGVVLIGAGLICAGLSVLMFFGCKVATKEILLLTKKMLTLIKDYIVKREEA